MIKDNILTKDKALYRRHTRFFLYSLIYILFMVISMAGILGGEGQEIAGIPLTLFLALGSILYFLFLAMYGYRSLLKPWAEAFDKQSGLKRKK